MMDGFALSRTAFTCTALPRLMVEPPHNRQYLCVSFDAFTSTRSFHIERDQPRLDQAWFWTPEWQAMEREANESLAAGDFEDFDSMDQFVDSLKNQMSGE